MSISFARSLSLSLLLVPALAVLGSACGVSDAASPVAPNQVQQSTTSDVKALCVQALTRNAQCTDQYIPALVDLRAKYDNPPGVAAEVAANRDGVIAQARAEFVVDSQPQAIDTMCNKIVGNPQYTQAEADAAQACLAIADCTAYTACILVQFENRFAQH